MASALNVSSTYDPMTFEEYWRNNYVTNYSVNDYDYNKRTNPNSLWNRFLNVFNGKVTSAKQAYETYLDKYNADYNAAQAAAANAHTEGREDTSAQRAVADYQAAGLNPYAAIAGGGSLISTSGSSSQAQMAQYKHQNKASKQEENESKMASTALKVLALVLLKKVL